MGGRSLARTYSTESISTTSITGLTTLAPIDLSTIIFNQFGYETKSSDAEATLYQDMNKQCSQAVKFILSPLRNLLHLEHYMQHMTFRTILRIAGMKSIMLLYQKIDDLPKQIPSVGPVTNMLIQPIAFGYLVPCFYMRSMLLGGNGVNSNNNNILISNSSTSVTTGSSNTVSLAGSRHPSSQGLDNATGAVGGNDRLVSNNTIQPFPIFINENEPLDGHYTVGLKCVNSLFLTELSKAFESLYEFIAQLLSRATWGRHRNIQCLTLATWGITISIDDHYFLNR